MTGESLTVWVHPTVPEGFFPVPLPRTDRLNFELGHSVPLFGPPTYEKYRTAPADEHVDNPDTAGFLANHLSHLKMLYPMEEWVRKATAALASTVEVDLLFTAHQIQQLRLVADFSSTSGATSAQDALSAYLITTLNRVLDVPITRVSSMLEVPRSTAACTPPPPPLRPHAVSNAIFQAHTPPQGLTPTEAASIGAIARTIRASITAAREYAHIKRVVAVSEPIWRRQSEEVLEHQFWPGEGEGRFVFNSMPKGDWSVSHFGYGLKASPVKQADGTWATDPKVNVNDPDTNGWKANAAAKNPNDVALRLFVRVPTAVRDAFLAAVAGDLMSPGFPQNLVWREREMQARISEGARAKL
ncbi:hypothetical protein B0H14DRAFT_3857604 [Mycena olivaceomarginata]|nr:hypothetical protein B0H14DRAFT_3857604 [Mycena olivaceomarginata]